MTERMDMQKHDDANAISRAEREVLLYLGNTIATIGERIHVMTDRHGYQWQSEDGRDMRAAYDAICACEAALVLLIDGGPCTVGKRMAARARTSTMAAVRDKVRRGTMTARDLAQVWQEMRDE
jgi:hypothetical protein